MEQPLRQSKLYNDINSPLYVLEESCEDTKDEIKNDKDLLQKAYENKLLNEEQKVVLEKFIKGERKNIKGDSMDTLVFLYLKCNIPIEEMLKTDRGLSSQVFLDIWRKYHMKKIGFKLKGKGPYFYKLGYSVGYFKCVQLAEFITDKLESHSVLEHYFEGITQAGFVTYLRKHPWKLENNSSRFLEILCERGDLETAKWLYKTLGYICIKNHNETIFNTACNSGSLPLVKWLVEIRPTINFTVREGKIFKDVCKKGYYEIAQFLYFKKPQFLEYVTTSFLKLLCKLKEFDILYWLMKLRKIKNKSKMWEYVFYKACQANLPLEKVKKFKIHSDFSSAFRVFEKTENILEKACLTGRLDVVKWLRSDMDTKITPRCLICACETENLNLIKWVYSLLEKDILTKKLFQEIFKKVCEKGHLKVAKWINGKSPHKINIEKIFFQVRYKNNLKILQWLYSIGPVQIHNKHIHYSYLSFEGEYREVSQWFLTLIDSIEETDIELLKTMCLNNDTDLVEILLEKDKNLVLTCRNLGDIVNSIVDLGYKTLLNLLMEKIENLREIKE